ncbi:Deoxyguanosinetriphosphate triphosphohydrolase-like protein [Waddlia chondrophila 2032/99]|uniref:Deoxyguanosinetriphosphate triphosphohydrolase-like protein n=2 Tax=Waddlia chondrophila TaxID=71667 RepID=F8LBW1_9BACT|nr:HD domain-containing protein [Waddlia chondrophila]ADI38788.1 putative deoxyguanosinetriphosphate triphosphohydrolase [Waddlia chondrophila WSU 86-1044]CCB90975.1 Deoxyguanosinetriphosphate triphosphohydrolase-like protein [Waddlia chondrophila 2032/99]
MKELPSFYPLNVAENVSPLLEKCRKKAQENEKANMHPMAAFSDSHKRYKLSEVDHRLPYKRDVDRIVHSKAYARYIDKTQVAYLIENDHITHRGLHVQLVGNFARGIAEILRLNLDLVEAVSLGHDVGHPPFGHEGEGYLSELTQEYGGYAFAHPYQSCRLFSKIEPLNLGLTVYDGILCHDGGMRKTHLEPRYGKTWDDHFKDLETKLKYPEETIIPATLEGCLVKLCDTMSYLGKDIEDAINLGIIERRDVPETLLGKSNREILKALACDIISNSFEKNYIAISDEAFEALKILRVFNFERIYQDPSLKKESAKVKRSYRILFEYLLQDFERQQENSYLWKNFLENKPEAYLKESSPIQKTADFIAGMTDSYFIRTLEKVFVPTRIEWRSC